ncbi:MAG: hypothetical protein M0P27_08125, partial [Bacteroidales bacterium]|nr:hypothetical protein [Bacteroidales bacterium]
NGYICKRNDSSYDMDLNIKIRDKYDFRFQINSYYDLDLDHILGTVANNFAWLDQLTGTIKNYNWDVTLHEKRSR